MWHHGVLDGRQVPDLYGIVVGAFADSGYPAPTASVFEESMHSWVILPPGIEHFPQGLTANTIPATTMKG